MSAARESTPRARPEGASIRRLAPYDGQVNTVSARVTAVYFVSSDISCAKSTLSGPLLTHKAPLYLMKPSFLNLFMK